MTTGDNFRNQLVQELQPLTPQKSVEDCNKGENTSFKGGKSNSADLHGSSNKVWTMVTLSQDQLQ
jgi:hypothetical protein